MRETRFFYADNAGEVCGLEGDEARHAVRVLRLGEGDRIVVADGKGFFYDAEITEASPRFCAYEILGKRRVESPWTGHLHLAVAPTKNIDRTEWLVEKATEIGVDEISFLECRLSERRNVNPERIKRIVVSAMKQSHKAVMPRVNAMRKTVDFLRQCGSGGERYIAHCLNDAVCASPPPEISAASPRCFLPAVMGGGDKLVMIGPEGDFTPDEVEAAVAEGFLPVSLGESRLRTETAAVYAAMLMNLGNSTIAKRLHCEAERHCPAQ